jgi:LytTr DNA-binding domain
VYLERIASPLGDRLCFLNLPRVTHFYAEDKLTYAVSEGKAYCLDYAIAELERKLEPKKFVRIPPQYSSQLGLDQGSRVASRRGFACSAEGWQRHGLNGRA